ncbi:hypothetical protein P0D69_27560 [Paraburkholderia sediminicola]|uniref:hypothetical protein n=1 Tax=Paraburkholderia sediminicola TaxID=458836 RepID=UPI0038BDDC37
MHPAGLIVVKAVYSAAFLTLAAVALVAFTVFLLATPETGTSPRKLRHTRGGIGRAGPTLCWNGP